MRTRRDGIEQGIQMKVIVVIFFQGFIRLPNLVITLMLINKKWRKQKRSLIDPPKTAKSCNNGVYCTLLSSVAVDSAAAIKTRQKQVTS